MEWKVLAIVEAAWVLAVAAWIIWERRSPTATLAWIFGLALAPVLGLVVYFLVGPRHLDRKKLRYTGLRKQLRSSLVAIEAHADVPSDVARQVKLGLRLGDAPLVTATSLELFRDGTDAFASIEQAIEDARHHVHLEYYIWEPGKLGTRLRDLLAAKARQGVEVRLLVDGVGTDSAARRSLAPVAAAGGEVATFNPLRFPIGASPLVNFRTHRKIVTCDGRVGFAGSMNVADCHVTGTPQWPKPWRDTQVRVEGTAVHGLQHVFLENWMFATGSAPVAPRYFPKLPAGPHLLQVLHSGPDRRDYPIHEFFFTAIAGADERVLVTCPYLVPDEATLTALRSAAHRGVDVQLLVPARSDSRFVDAAMRSFFAELLTAGAKVHEYTTSMIHAKTLVIDRELAIVGSPNLDTRSFRLHFEVAVAVYGAETADLLASWFAADLKNARTLTLEAVEQRPFPARFGEATARLFATVL